MTPSSLFFTIPFTPTLNSFTPILPYNKIL